MTFYEEICKLKNVVRKGWVLRNVQGRVESDAEHTFSMIMLGLEIMNKNKMDVDELKVLKMIAYHEICEIDVGDITPFDNISKQEKFDREYLCIKRLAKEYNMPEVEQIWFEYEKGETKEAIFVKKLDKFDAVLQSKIYAYEQNNQKLYEEFKLSSNDICKEFEKKLKF